MLSQTDEKSGGIAKLHLLATIGNAIQMQGGGLCLKLIISLAHHIYNSLSAF